MSKTVFLCTGKSCRKKKKETERVIRSLEKDLSIRPVRCQNICSGPVLGCALGGRWEWFKKVRKPREIAELRRSIHRDKATDSLKKLHVKKRSGKLKS
ncbi:MAG: hypothetical protein VX589_02915 [Myxococcota bacterium]|nr:hypothetical protein [Myxococcota bacterium]